MKRRRSPVNPHLIARRGTMFHYYMTYLLLSSVLLTTAGMCMHTILKADRVDAQVSVYLKTLMRLDQTLRTDAAVAVHADVKSDQLVLTLEDESEIRWIIKERLITRELYETGKLRSSERYSFYKGTTAQFDEIDERIRLRLKEPPAVPDNAGTSDHGKFVEVVFVVDHETLRSSYDEESGDRRKEGAES